MSELSTNKVLGAILAASLITVGLGVIVPEFFPREPPAKPGDLVAVAAEDAGGAAAAPEVPPDWGTVLPKADVAAGQAATAVCQACHNFSAAGTNMIGPGLYGVVGRKPGSHPGFAYSSGMEDFAKKTPVWDYQHIYDFIKGPQAYISGTKMTFAGLKDSQARINIIAYLHTLGSTLPVPPPKPAAATPKPAAGAGASPTAAGGASPATAGATPTPAAVQPHPGGDQPAP
ncbi:MAG TPA: cytochrome c family protein [Caulobacteraceae bacterium]|jgi:cytochrome c|nr:cytochrome c family protein [Caulobacteraceae bacterium]